MKHDTDLELMPPRADWTRGVGLIFLVGASRSGTTWLQALLAGHPAICTGPETHFFRTYRPVHRSFLRKRDRPLGPAEYWTHEQFFSTIEAQFWALISQLSPSESPPRFFLEKTPIHVIQAPFILDVFPEARFIHLIRDGRDVTASYLRISSSWGQSWAPQTAFKGAELWQNRVKAGRSIPGEIAARGGDVAGQYREVRYEAVKQDSDREVEALCEWLGLDGAFQPPNGFDTIPTVGRNTNVEAAEHYPDDFIGSVATSSSSPVNGLTPTQRRIVEVVAGPLLQQLGYATGRAASGLPPSGKIRKIGLGLLRRMDKLAHRA